MRAALAAPTYIRSGLARSKVPHAAWRGRRAPRGMGPFSTAASFSPPLQPVTHPTLDLINSFCRRSDRCWLPLDDGTLRCDAALEIAPQRHRQLTRQRHHGDAADTALGGADTVAVPDAQCAVGLVTQPQPGKLHHRGARLAVAGFADPLLALRSPALERARREAQITAELAAIVEFPIEHFADQHAGEFGADRPELVQSLDLLRVEMRRCLVANDGVAFRLNGADHLQHDFETLQFPSDLRFQPRGQLLALHRAQLFQSRHPLWAQRLIVVDPVDRAKPLDAVGVLDALLRQSIPLAVQPPRVLFRSEERR